jgi:HK97 family phage prohead protease
VIQFIHVPITLDAAAGDESPRTITGVAVPWDTAAAVSSGEKVSFKRGAFDLNAKAPKLLENHDMAQLRGVVVELADDDAGLLFTAKFANTKASDEAIELVKAGAYDSVSVGAVPVKFKYDDKGVMVVSQANLIEISLVAQPAFADAVITEIAASEPEADETPTPDIPEEEPMSNENPAVEASAEIVTTTPIHATARREYKLPSLGEYMSKILAGGVEAQQFLANLKAAAPDVTTSDTPGILPEPIIGNVYNNFLPNYRPLVTAMGTKAMPQGGKIFRRPSVTTHTTIGLSNGENQPLDDGTFVVSDNPVTKQVFGGFVQLSEEDQEWTEPAVLSLLVDDMARIYAQQTDVYACAQFEAGVTQTATLTSAIDPADWIAFVYEAAQTILLNSNGNLPNVLIMDPLYFRTLGALVDQEGRPLFPTIGPMNASGSLAPTEFGGTAFGLQIVVDKNLVKAGGNNIYVGRSDGFECFEQPKGAISVEAADGSLSRFIKFRGYFATLMIDDTKFVTRA